MLFILYQVFLKIYLYLIDEVSVNGILMIDKKRLVQVRLIMNVLVIVCRVLLM